MKCRNCGSPLEKGDIFCENCGTPVNTGKNGKNGRKRTGLILGICAGVLAITAVGVGAGVAVKMLRKSEMPKEESYVPEEMVLQPEEKELESAPEVVEKKIEPLSYTSELIHAGSYVIVEYPVFSGGEYPDAVQRLNETFKSEAEHTASEQEAELNDIMTSAEADGMDISVSFERSLQSVYIEESLICVEQLDYSYTGGAHGLAGLWGINYNLETERELSMEEVLGCSSKIAEEAAILAFSRTELVQEGIITLEQVRENLDGASYCKTEEGLHIVFQQYSLGAYAIGMPDAVVTAQDVKDASEGKAASLDGVLSAYTSDTANEEKVPVMYGLMADADDFIFPYSSTQVLTAGDLEVLEADTTEEEHARSQLAINEILARYGFTFDPEKSDTSRDAWEKFSGLSWYQQAQPLCNYQKGAELVADLNEIEKANVNIINEWQKAHGCYY